jgi:phage-related minor tail protein
MSVLSPKKKNVYLDKVNENLTSFFRIIEKYNQIIQELSQSINGATVHINDIERILGENDGEEGEDEEQQTISDNERESMAGEKLCELNDNLNVSLRDIRQSW